MEKRYTDLAVELSEDTLVVGKEAVSGSGTMVKIHGPVSIPSDRHGLDCLDLINLIARHSGNGSTVVIVSLNDEFDYCRDGRCTISRFCKQFPKGTKFVSLQPFKQVVL